jgi:hypothetical protein
MPVKVKMDLTNKAAKQLLRFDKIMAANSEWLRGRIIRNWLRGKSPDGSPFRSLSTKAFFFNVGSATSKEYMQFEGGYKQFKAASGRNPIRDFMFSGKMHQGFKVFKKGAFRYILGFAAPEKDKARGNKRHAQNMLSISKKLETAFTKRVEKDYWKKVK